MLGFKSLYNPNEVGGNFLGTFNNLCHLPLWLSIYLDVMYRHMAFTLTVWRFPDFTSLATMGTAPPSEHHHQRHLVSNMREDQPGHLTESHVADNMWLEIY